jgi:hypothetical protein
LRYVKYDHKKLKYPPDWEDKAKKAKEAVEAADAGKRSDVINNHQPVWASLKHELSKVFHGKCWYTEAPQDMAGTDSDVDHFRPKNAVRGVKRTKADGTEEEHPGYWWLAFEASNYRFSCIIANRPRRDLETGLVGGKVDEFPIWDEKLRCWKKTDCIDDEQPSLIDPCKSTEVALLMFAENGEITTRYSKDDKKRLFEKADNSIKLYHLNHTNFVKARLEIRDELEKHIKDARRYYKKLDKGDATNDHAYERAIEQIRKTISIKSPFSGFAYAFIQKFKHEECLEAVFS